MCREVAERVQRVSRVCREVVQKEKKKNEVEKKKKQKKSYSVRYPESSGLISPKVRLEAVEEEVLLKVALVPPLGQWKGWN